jgi:hypothetical protein
MFAWLVLNIIGHIPVWIWPTLALVAFLVYTFADTLRELPQVKPWSYLLIPTSLGTIFVSIFMWGSSGVTNIYQAQIKEVEHQRDVAVQAAKDASAQIRTIYVDRVVYVKAQTAQTIKELETVKNKIDSKCNVDEAAINLLNEATK